MSGFVVFVRLIFFNIFRKFNNLRWNIYWKGVGSSCFRLTWPVVGSLADCDAETFRFFENSKWIRDDGGEGGVRLAPFLPPLSPPPLPPLSQLSSTDQRVRESRRDGCCLGRCNEAIRGPTPFSPPFYSLLLLSPFSPMPSVKRQSTCCLAPLSIIDLFICWFIDFRFQVDNGRLKSTAQRWGGGAFIFEFFYISIFGKCDGQSKSACKMCLAVQKSANFFLQIL